MFRKRLTHIYRYTGPAAILVSTAASVVLVCTFASPSFQIGYVGVLVAAVLAMLAAQRASPLPVQLDAFEDPLVLAKDEQFYEHYRGATDALKTISINKDPIYRNLALQRTAELTGELGHIAEGRFNFVGTETWRMTYAQLLRSPGLHLYRSIAYVKTATYWQDQPGRHSMQVNVQMVENGSLSIERVAIVPDHLWPAGERFPIDPIHDWIARQNEHGISIKLVRQSTLANDPDLVTDLGIYGNRAVGVQEVDGQGRTVRFTLAFDFVEVLAAEQRWDRLSVYATPYRELLEPVTVD